MNINLLKKLGFSDKSAQIYLALLRLGPSSVRTIADYTGLNRGTAYDSLKWLQEQDIVEFYHKDTKQTFVATDPEQLHTLVREQTEALSALDEELGKKLIPELQALHHKGGERPVAKYYEREGIRLILEDVLETCEQHPEQAYRIYSTEGIRKYLYDNFSTFSDVRIAKGIHVKVVAIGGGGELRGLDERKWLPGDVPSSTYILMYPGKTAYVSLDAKQEPIGVVIENPGVYETQKMIFDALWEKL